VTGTNFDVSQAAGVCVSHRIVGIRATLTVTDSLTTATGSVFAGDTNDYYSDDVGSRLHFDYAQSDYDIRPKYTNTNSALAGNVTLSETNVRPRVTQAGPWMKGAIYEASCLPSTDRALDYCDRLVPLNNDSAADKLIALGSPAATDYYENLIGEALANNLGVMFDLRGLATDASCTIDVTVAFEMQVEPHSSIGFLYAEARFAPRFVPDWMEFACCCPGGPLGSVMKHYVTCGRKGMGFLANATGLDIAHHPAATGTGAVRNDHALSESKHVAAHLANAAVGAAVLYQNKSIFARAARGLESQLGRIGGSIARIGGRSAPMIEEASMLI
jgi:hypothetical protein